MPTRRTPNCIQICLESVRVNRSGGKSQHSCIWESAYRRNNDLLRNVSVLHLQDMAILKTLDLTPMEMLRNLTIIKCLELENIRGIQGLSNLCYFIIKGCHRDLRFPGVECLMALRHVEVDSENSNNWPIKVSPGLSQSSNLEFLRLSGLRNLEEFPSFTGLTNLVTFVLERMPNLKELPSFTGLPKLATIELRELQSLKEDPSSLGELTGSRPLMLSEMPNLTEHLEEFPCLSGWSNLRVLVLHNMEKLRVLSSFAELTGLRSLSLGDMPHLEEVPCLSGLSNLRELLLDKMEKLRVLPSFAELTGLVRLILGKMPHLEEVPCLSGLSELTNLKCVTLMKLPKVRDVPRVIGLSDCRHIWWHEMGQTLLLRFRFHELFGLQHLNWAKMPYLEECELLRLTMLICGTMIEVFRELPCLNGFNEFREFKLERVANLRVANLGCIIAIHSNHHI